MFHFNTLVIMNAVQTHEEDSDSALCKPKTHKKVRSYMTVLQEVVAVS